MWHLVPGGTGDGPNTHVCRHHTPRGMDAKRTANALVESPHDIDVGNAATGPVCQEIGMQALATGAMSVRMVTLQANADLFNYAPTTDDSPFFYQSCTEDFLLV